MVLGDVSGFQQVPQNQALYNNFNQNQGQQRQNYGPHGQFQQQQQQHHHQGHVGHHQQQQQQLQQQNYQQQQQNAFNINAQVKN